jgi:serine/threonine protein kinase
MKTPAAAVCSTCGQSLNWKGHCRACLMLIGFQEPASETAATLPLSIGPYRIVRELGRGGMGTVYLAERADEQYEKQVAIKLIKRGMDTDSVLRHFWNERQILAGFDHPNIARLFDGGVTEDGLPYFVMEYVEGIPIDHYCEAHQFSVIERLKLFREVCAAVSYAHRHLVVHRDIKSTNILVTKEGVAKLLDFGIAKILQPGESGQPLATLTGLRLMTPEYASPEQVRGQVVTTASDVYSLGIVLYELLTGRFPYRFASKTPQDIERTITEQIPERPSAITRDHNQLFANGNQKALRGDLDNIALMALRKEPERRYQSVEQLSEDIQRHLKSRPILARKDNIAYRAGKFVRRNRIAIAAGSLVLLSLVAGLVATTWEARRERRRFNDVRQLAHSVLFDYHDAIKDLPGATKVRERLVKDALTYLDSLAKEAGGDPALQRELAAAYERVGDVRGQVYSASLGDRAGATESYLKALRIREALVAAAPRSAQGRRDLAAIYEKAGTELLETKEAPRGLEQLRKALTLYSELVVEQPARQESRSDLAEIHETIGLALEFRGDMPGALEQHYKALAICQQLVAANPKDRRLRRILSDSYETMGRALFQSSDARVADALEANHKAVALLERLLAEEPTDNEYRRRLAISYQNDGDYRAWLKDFRGALESFRKKIAIDEQSFAADPANAQARSDLAYSGERIADLLVELRDYSQALPYYRRALEMYDRSMAADPKELGLPIRAIIVRARLGKAQAKLGQLVSARKECDKAADLLRPTVDAPTDVNQRRLRVVAYTDLGEAFALLAADKTQSPAAMDQDWRAAREMYQTGLSLMQQLRTSGILGADELPELETIAHKIADCDKALGK